MNAKSLNFLVKKSLLIFSGLAILGGWQPAEAQPTAFTYQGRLFDGTNRATGAYDLTFALYSDSDGINQIGGTVTKFALGVTNGLFTTTLDFGSGIFTGYPLWLEIGVETNGGSGFTDLFPLQPLTPTPYAIFAAGAAVANSAGSAGSAGFAVTAQMANSVASGSVSGSGIASGAVVKSLNNLQDNVTLSAGANVTITPTGNTLTIASSGSGDGGGNAWLLNGNAGTSPLNGNFLGTTDLEPLELWVNGTRALRLEPHPLGFGPNVIGGSVGNFVANGLYGATIGGGGTTNFEGEGFGLTNSVIDNFGTIAGGLANIAAFESAVGGGTGNSATAPSATIAGGAENSASSTDATVGGGEGNLAGEFAATIGGGYVSKATGDYSTVPGGYGNAAAGKFSLAAGQGAAAMHDGTFVWADSQNPESSGPTFFSTGINQFCIRAGGGVQLDPTTSIFCGSQTRQMLNLYSTTYGIGVQNSDEYFRTAGEFFWYNGGVHNDNFANAGGGTQLMRLGSTGNLIVTGTVTANSVLLTSDRNAKEQLDPINPQTVLDKVAALPISEWNFKDDKTTRHIGPMAQDFHAQFQLGSDDKHIAVVDEGGVALAAIQGLNQKLDEKEAKIQEQASSLRHDEAEISDLKARLEKLERFLEPQSGGK